MVQDKDVLDLGLLDGESTCTELTEETCERGRDSELELTVAARVVARVRVSAGGARAGEGGTSAGCLLSRLLLLLDEPSSSTLAGLPPHLQLRQRPAVPSDAGRAA